MIRMLFISIHIFFHSSDSVYLHFGIHTMVVTVRVHLHSIFTNIPCDSIPSTLDGINSVSSFHEPWEGLFRVWSSSDYRSARHMDHTNDGYVEENIFIGFYVFLTEAQYWTITCHSWWIKKDAFMDCIVYK